MKYELLLQSGDVATPFDPDAVATVLAAHGSKADTWRLKNGDVELTRIQQDGRPNAINVRVPLSEKLDLIREVVVESAAIAEEAKVCVFDPQLGRAITAKDDGIVADQFFRVAQYAGMMLGVSEALGASLGPPDDGKLKAGTKVFLAIIAVLVVGYWVLDWLTRR